VRVPPPHYAQNDREPYKSGNSVLIEHKLTESEDQEPPPQQPPHRPISAHAAIVTDVALSVTSIIFTNNIGYVSSATEIGVELGVTEFP
jgi:hypothetical protein